MNNKMMNLENVKNFFPFNNIEVYPLEFGYSMTIEHAKEIPFSNSWSVTHFTVLDNGTVVAYMK